MKLSGIKIFVFLIWFVGLSVPLSFLHSFHSMSLPKDDVNLKAIEAVPRDLMSTKKWEAFHFLTPKCLCSNSIGSYLYKRGLLDPENLEEFVIIVGNNVELKEKLSEKGFHVREISEQSLKSEFNITGVPLLMFKDSKGSVYYQGGYASSNINKGTAFQDKKLYAAIQTGLAADALPKIGCAVSKELQKKLDPFGLKYDSL